MLIIGPQGFERTVQFAVDEDEAEITERVRATIRRMTVTWISMERRASPRAIR